jgi:hypothetical protein
MIVKMENHGLGFVGLCRDDDIDRLCDGFFCIFLQKPFIIVILLCYYHFVGCCRYTVQTYVCLYGWLGKVGKDVGVPLKWEI